MQLKKGTTRIVILTKRYAFKIPNITCYRLFLQGLLSNIQEGSFSGIHENLCPTLFCFYGGFLNIMPRCKSLTNNEFYYFSKHFKKYVNKKNIVLPVENKKSSFGIYKKKIVAVDYGS